MTAAVPAAVAAGLVRPAPMLVMSLLARSLLVTFMLAAAVHAKALPHAGGQARLYPSGDVIPAC